GSLRSRRRDRDRTIAGREPIWLSVGGSRSLRTRGSVMLQMRDALADQRDVLRGRRCRRVGLECLERVLGVALLRVRKAEAAIAADIAGVRGERLLVLHDRAAGVTREQPLVAGEIRRAGAIDRAAGGHRRLRRLVLVVFDDDLLAAERAWCRDRR